MNKTSASNNGFTLIELMVAIAIVAVLATVGLVVFSNTQKQARDSRRTQDVSAVANALESAKSPTSIYYSTITGANFAGGVVPVDPRSGSTSGPQNYCLFYNTSVPPARPPTGIAVWGGSNCPGGIGAGTVTVNNTSTLILPANVTSWTICAKLENSASLTCQYSKL